MTTFRYRATDKKGTLITDQIEAASEEEAKTSLEDKKLKVLVLKEISQRSFLGLSALFKSKFPIGEKTALCRHLSIMISTGVPIEDSFALLIEGVKNKTVKEVLQNVSFSLRKGQSLYSSFSKYKDLFGEIFLSMLKAGEVSGTLDRSFKYLSQQYKQEEELRKKVVSALLYPAIIVCLMLAVGTLMVTFVLPRLSKIFMSLNVELPIMTRLLLQLTIFLEKNTLLSLLVIVTLVLSITIFLKSKAGRNFLYSLGSKLPIVKEILLHYNLARFTQSLGALLRSSVSIGESLEIASQSLIIPNKRQLSRSFKEKVSKGLPLTTVFTEAKIFPPLMIQMVTVGEKTGSLEKILTDVSTFYREEVENSLKNFITILEPILMILVGIAVGIMVLSFIAPIYSLIGKLQPG